MARLASPAPIIVTPPPEAGAAQTGLPKLLSNPAPLEPRRALAAGRGIKLVVNNYQRVGSVSNAHAGRDFEIAAQRHFLKQGLALERPYRVPIAVSGKGKKAKAFDLGAADPPVLVECKSHRWTAGDRVPSGKIAKWNEAVYCLSLAPQQYRKILFVLRDYSVKRQETLATYYCRTYAHLIPDYVEIIEHRYPTSCEEREWNA